MKYTPVLLLLLLSSCFSLQKNSFGSEEQADELANKIMKATHQDLWEETKVIQWTFRLGGHSHIWDRERKLEYVKFGDYEVWLNLKTKGGLVKKGGERVEADKQKYLDKAWSYWINDSFWLNPIAKFYDEGVTRSLVHVKSDTALMVSYSQGGLTPGDSYLWLVDENGLPKAWELWVSIIPIKGFQVSWEDWREMDSGVLIAEKHNSMLVNVNLENVKGAKSVKALFGTKDPFSELLE